MLYIMFLYNSATLSSWKIHRTSHFSTCNIFFYQGLGVQMHLQPYRTSSCWGDNQSNRQTADAQLSRWGGVQT